MAQFVEALRYKLEGRGFDSPMVLLEVFIDVILKSSRNLCTEQSPKESDDTKCCFNTIVLLKMSIVVLETCRQIH